MKLYLIITHEPLSTICENPENIKPTIILFIRSLNIDTFERNLDMLGLRLPPTKYSTVFLIASIFWALAFLYSFFGFLSVVLT